MSKHENFLASATISYHIPGQKPSHHNDNIVFLYHGVMKYISALRYTVFYRYIRHVHKLNKVRTDFQPSSGHRIAMNTKWVL